MAAGWRPAHSKRSENDLQMKWELHLSDSTSQRIAVCNSAWKWHCTLCDSGG